MKDYEQDYENFWKEIVENPDGSINMDQVKRELHDFGTLIKNTSIVYEHVTGGLISKPLTDPYAVISEADDSYRRSCDELLEEEIKMWKEEGEN